MKKQTRFASAVLLSLVFWFSGPAWADRGYRGGESIRARGNSPYLRDRSSHGTYRTARPHREHRSLLNCG